MANRQLTTLGVDMEIGQRYTKLLEVAKVDSSERRRELLNEITDLFFESEEKTQVETALFGELMAKVAFELNQEVRKELSMKFEGGEAPRELALALANDTIDVAYPIIRSSKSFTDSDLIQIVADKETQYQLAVTERDTLSEAVSDALVDHGDDNVVASLLRNEGAKIGDTTYGKVVERAEANPALHHPFVMRQSVPLEFLNEVYMTVGPNLRREIMERNQSVTPEELNRAMEKAKQRVVIKNSALPEDYERMERKLLIMKSTNSFSAQQLPNIWRNGDHTLFRLAFADLCGLDYQTIDNLVKRKDIDGLAMLCRAKDLERGLFVALAVFVLGDEGMGNAEKLGKLYNDVPIDAAGRALRFMQVRMNVTKNAA